MIRYKFHIAQNTGQKIRQSVDILQRCKCLYMCVHIFYYFSDTSLGYSYLASVTKKLGNGGRVIRPTLRGDEFMTNICKNSQRRPMF